MKVLFKMKISNQFHEFFCEFAFFKSFIAEVVVVSSHEAEEAEPMINEISDEKIDRVLSLLHEADPTSPETDAVELPGAFFENK